MCCWKAIKDQIRPSPPPMLMKHILFRDMAGDDQRIDHNVDKTVRKAFFQEGSKWRKDALEEGMGMLDILNPAKEMLCLRALFPLC